MSALGRYLRTARHLRPGQLGWRIVHEARSRLYRARPGWCRWAFAPRPGARLAGLTLAAPPVELLGRERETADRWRSGEVLLLGIPGPAADWVGAGRSRLWRYERHYHRELVTLAALAAAEPAGPWAAAADGLVASWVAACPPPAGDGWEPYPVARRLLSWSQAFALAPRLGQRFAPHLAGQLRFLAGHLERHLLGNHLLCDAAALVAASAVLDDAGAGEIGEAGLRLLAAELERQVLPDGGYAERTAQYHALVLEDALVALGLWRRRGRPAPPRLEVPLRRMAHWVSLVRRGDALPWLNDAAPGAAPAAGPLLALAGALGVGPPAEDGWLARAFGAAPGPPAAAAHGVVQLPDTGWTMVREGAHELLFEHGPIGPPEQPGHGHSDALSVELTWGGVPVLTDSGVTTYEIGPVRDFERSAMAHAVVTVRGEGPDELWSSFRVGARGRVRAAPPRRLPPGLHLLAGELESPQGWRHRRSVLFWPGVALVVRDRVQGADGAAVQARLPLAPGVGWEGGSLRLPGGELRLHLLRGTLSGAVRGGEAPREGWQGQGFGAAAPRWSLALSAGAEAEIAWALAGPDTAVELDGERCRVRSPRGGAEARLDGGDLP